MKKLSTVLFVAFLLLGLASCNDKDSLPDMEIEGIFVETEWENIGETVSPPSLYNIQIINEDNDFFINKNLSGNGNTIIAQPGDYKIQVFNVPANMSASKNIATINSRSDGMEALPGWFFRYSGVVSVQGNVVSSITASMEQETKELKLEPTITGITGTIEKAEIKLEGLAKEMDIISGDISTPSSVTVNCTIKTNNVISATIRTLGVIGSAVQTLTVTVTIDGTPYTITKDLSNDLKNFNDDKLTPYTWAGELNISAN